MNLKKEYYCPICGRRLTESEIEGYNYQCMYCDEDFTNSEVIIITKAMNNKSKKQNNTDVVIDVDNSKKSRSQTVHETCHEIVGECKYCGKPLTLAEVDRYGFVCKRCYMEESYI